MLFERGEKVFYRNSTKNHYGLLPTSNESFYAHWRKSNSWLLAINAVEVGILIGGLVGNILMLICLFRRTVASKLTNLLLKIQSFVDASVCIIALIFLIEPVNFWKSGNTSFDLFLCHIWHSQMVYWALVFLSIQNLVFIAFDRFWAVVSPQNYKYRQAQRIKFIVPVIFFYSILVGLPNAFLTYFHEGQCVSRTEFTSLTAVILRTGFAMLWFFTAYLLPTIIFVTLYTKVILVLYKTQKHTQTPEIIKDLVDQSSPVICRRRNKAHQLTKAMVIVTTIFIASLSFDSFYFLLGGFDSVRYDVYSPMQKVAIFLVSLNSSVNIYVYLITMKSFRDLFVSTLGFDCGKTHSLELQRSSIELRNKNLIDSIAGNSSV